MRKLIFVLLAIAAMLGGAAGVADAMADPFPTCIRECSPLPRLPQLPPLPI